MESLKPFKRKKSQSTPLSNELAFGALGVVLYQARIELFSNSSSEVQGFGSMLYSIALRKILCPMMIKSVVQTTLLNHSGQICLNGITSKPIEVDDGRKQSR